MKIRLMGLPAEVDAITQALRESPALTIVSQSSPYANRGDSGEVRVYVEVRATDTTVNGATR